MNATNWVIELMKALGYGGIGASLIFFLAKYILKPSLDNYFKFRLDKANIEEQSRFKIAEMYEQAKINTDDKINTAKLEMETVRLNRVLPILEDLNINLVQHRIMYYTYVHWILNNGRLRDGFESERLKIDGDVIELINKVAIYLPKEMRALLYSLRAVISVSWTNPETLHYTIKQDGLDLKEIGHKTTELYNSYIECFYEMVNAYCKIKKDDTVYAKILQKYNFNEKGQILLNDFMTKYVKAYILHHEFTSGDVYIELNDELSKRKI